MLRSRAEGLRREQLVTDLALERRARWTVEAIVRLLEETDAVLDRVRAAA